MTGPVWRAAVTAALLVALGSGCGGASDATDAAASQTSAASPTSAALSTQPAPAGFPVGTYSRLVKFEGQLDGRWEVALDADGTFRFTDPAGGGFDGTFEVPATGRLVLHGPDCPDPAPYTYASTSGGLKFVDAGNDECDDGTRHALLGGYEWLRKP